MDPPPPNPGDVNQSRDVELLPRRSCFMEGGGRSVVQLRTKKMLLRNAQWHWRPPPVATTRPTLVWHPPENSKQPGIFAQLYKCAKAKEQFRNRYCTSTVPIHFLWFPRCSHARQSGDVFVFTVADPGGALGARAPLAPKISSKSCSFQAILRGNPLFWANFGLRDPPWGQNSAAPLTNILDPCLLHPAHLVLVLEAVFMGEQQRLFFFLIVPRPILGWPSSLSLSYQQFTLLVHTN